MTMQKRRLNQRNVSSGRVEDGHGSLGLMANAPFPIPAHQGGRAAFGIRLSDWLQRHTAGPLGGAPPSLCSRAFSEGFGSFLALSGSSPITFTSPSSKAHQKSEPPAPPVLLGIKPIPDIEPRRSLRLLRIAWELAGAGA